ncbi:MAG TPA: hypothetical protein EYO84_12595 [Planctomycetes bacterium]|nr:hypothetical protein [Planctomycetota bacterium]
MKPQQQPDPMAFPGSSIHQMEELQKKGIRKLRIISESQLKQTAREAVAHALLEALDGLDVPDVVRQELRIRAAKILGKEQIEVPQEQHKEQIEAPQEQYKEQIEAPQEQQLAPVAEIHVSSPLVIPSVSNPSADVSIGAPEVDEKAPGSPLGKRENALLLQLSRLIAQDWRSELALVRDSQRAQVERLEMRIQELTMALQATDQVLETNAKSRQEPAEITIPFDNKKSELLDQLFQANVALRALSQGQSQGISPSRDGEGK